VGFLSYAAFLDPHEHEKSSQSNLDEALRKPKQPDEGILVRLFRPLGMGRNEA
jgi:hypothetical protein